MAHDPGGKVRIPLPAAMAGGAFFCGADGGEGDTHRPMLWRKWGGAHQVLEAVRDAREGKPVDAAAVPWSAEEWVLFIGMNPSTADAAVDDPTVKREVGFTQRMGFCHYRKANVMDYRATSPKALLAPGVEACSAINHRIIVVNAGLAARVVLAFGALPPALRFYYAEPLVRELSALGIPLYCLGTTRDGSPRHPLYLASSAELQPWKGWNP